MPRPRGCPRTVVTALLLAPLAWLGPAQPTRAQTTATSKAGRVDPAPSSEALESRVAEINAAFREAKAREARSDLAGAVAAARKAIALVIEVFGESHESLPEALGELARMCEARDDFDGARAALSRIVDFAKRRQGEASWEAGDAQRGVDDLVRRAAMGTDQRRALRQAQSDYAQAAILNTSGRRRDAIALLEKSLAVRLAILGPDHPLTAQCLHRLGVVHAALKEFDVAQRDYESALAAPAIAGKGPS